MSDTATADAPPVFTPQGGMQGNLTSNQGQPPAQPQAQPLAPQSPLSAMGPPPAPTPPPPQQHINYPPMPQMGQQQKLGPAPDAKEYQKGAMEFASAMAVLGAVAGRFTRVPGGAALSAFAGALKGWQTGNLQAYEEAAKKWEQDTKATIENNRVVLEKYKAALEDRKSNIDEQMANIQLISAQYHDKIMYDAAQSKNYTMVAQIYEKNQTYTHKVEDSAAKLKEKRDEQKTKNQQRATYWKSPQGQTELNAVNPDGTPKYNDGQKAGVKWLIDQAEEKNAKPQNAALERFLAEHPQATAEEIQKFQQAAHPPRSAQAMAVEKFKEEHPEATAEDVQKFVAKQAGLNAGERTAATTATNLDIIMRNAHAAIPMAEAASDKVPRGNWVPINKLVQTADSQISDPALKEFKMANLQLAELWARAMNPKGVMRESDREMALGILSTADSPETYKRMTAQLRNFLERERTSVREFREGKEPEAGSNDATAPSPTSGGAPPGTIPPGWDVKVN
jgi:hypothetical protein